MTPTIQVTRAPQWHITSERSGNAYTLTIAASGRILCSCPARSGACYHIREAQEGVYGKPRARVRVLPTVTGRLPVDDLYAQ